MANQTNDPLDELCIRYDALSAKSDSEVCIDNANDYVLKNDPVYNSDKVKVDERVKNAIRTRRLEGISQEEFKSLYSQAVVDIEEDRINREERAIVLANQLDVVPTSVDNRTLAVSGNKRQYVLAKCKQYGITRSGLADMVQMRRDYSVKFPTVFKLIERGYDLEQIGEILETRERFRNNDSGMPSLNKICQLVEHFGLDVDAETLASAIEGLHEEFDCKYVESSIKAAIATAEALNTRDLEFIMDGGIGSSATLEDDYSEDSGAPCASRRYY